MGRSDFPENDTEFEETTVKAVRDGCFDREDGWTFSDCGAAIKVGDKVRFYGGGIGGIVRGLFVNGEQVFYRTEAEQHEKHRQESEEKERKDREDFEKNRANFDMRFADLPEVFQRRIKKFRDTNPDFRWKYEKFCCEEAVKMATHLKTTDALEAFKGKSFEEQKALVPIDDGHSGNTFGMACRLAYWFLKKPENVVAEHGALVPLVGCADYGCPHEEAAP